MNILITGASRGIGAAAYALLKKTGHRVVGHSTRGSDTLIAGDLCDPAAPRDIWDTALDELGGTIDVLVNNAGIYEGVPDNASDDEWHAAWQRTLTINLQSAADLSRLAVSHFLDRRGRRGDPLAVDRCSRLGDRQRRRRQRRELCSLASLSSPQPSRSSSRL